MSDQQQARRTLQDLVRRDDLKNKTCADCSSPNPQWASLSHAIFLCLQCAGVHRGFGVHVSFVRSISMDTWQDEQLRRMQLGGNGPFKDFLRSYTPADQGGYKDGASPHDVYHSWAAAQYREKLDAALADKPWSPSAPPPDFASRFGGTPSTSRPSSAQGLRKSRASTRTASASGGGGSNSLGDPFPAAARGSPRDSPEPNKAANESFFASLGQTNASRPADLPPSQGGRYQGFGNTPPPPPPTGSGLGMDDAHAQAAPLSSAAAPSLAELQERPLAALGKGWTLFSRAVAGAGRAVSEHVIQPGVDRAMDPGTHAAVRGYATAAQRGALGAGRAANQWGKRQLGVDVAEQVGGVVGAVKDRIGGGPQSEGYGAVATEQEAETSALYLGPEDEGDFLAGFPHAQPAQASPMEHTKGKDEWDEWKDF